jgi:hypothetical protein
MKKAEYVYIEQSIITESTELVYGRSGFGKK